MQFDLKLRWAHLFEGTFSDVDAHFISKVDENQLQMQINFFL